jgi:hypothetical protein
MNQQKGSEVIWAVIAIVLIGGAVSFYLSHKSVASSTPQADTSFECPATRNGLELKIAYLYDGLTSDRAMLEADQTISTDSVGRWDLSQPAASPEGYYVGCFYETRGDGQPDISVKLSETVKSCETSGANIACSSAYYTK